jgi:hypothetical protein
LYQQSKKHTISSDQVIDKLIHGNNCFIPIAVGPYGNISSLFCCFLTLTGDKVIDIDSFGPDRSNAVRAYNTSKHIRTTYNVLGLTNRSWKTTPIGTGIVTMALMITLKS